MSLSGGHERSSRRDVLAVGVITSIAAMVPHAVAQPAPGRGVPEQALAAASASSGRPRLAPSGIAQRLREVRETYAAAVAEYRLAGDACPIEMARLRARSRFGFALGLEAVSDDELALFREAGALIGQMEADFPELPLDPGMKARFATLRAWAEAGGQYRLLRRRSDKRRLLKGGAARPQVEQET